jgi:hypothetical protein
MMYLRKGVMRVSAIGLLALLLVACMADAPATREPSPSSNPTQSAASPLPTATATASPRPTSQPTITPSATPTVTPPPATASPMASPAPQVGGPGWTEIGRAGNRSTEITGVVGFSGGYVVSGDDSTHGASYWFSADGQEWQRGVLAEKVDDCAGEPTWDAYTSGAASDGTRLIILGKQLLYDPVACANSELGGGVIAWTSVDGRNWTRSEPFAHTHAIFSRAWSVPGGGWEGLVDSWDQPTSVWRSEDGVRWVQATSFPAMQGYAGAAAVGRDGRRLLASERDEQPVLLSSTDGSSWGPLSSGPDFGRHAWVNGIVPPDEGGRWLVVTEEAERSVIHHSADLSSWTKQPFPAARVISHIRSTSAGYLASAERADRYFSECDGIGCPGPAERQYLSVDGVDWAQVEPRIQEGASFADGPAGVIAVGRYSGEVWLLQP